jgi:hypothetical protein
MAAERQRVWIVNSSAGTAADSSGTVITAGEVIYPPGAALGPLARRGYALFLVHAGYIDMELDGQAFRAAAGEMAFVKPGARQLYRFAEDQRCRYIWLTLVNPPAAPEELRLLPELPVGTLAGGGAASVMAALVTAIARLADRAPPPRGALQAAVAAAFALYAEEARARGLLGGERRHPAVLAACDAASRNLSERLTLDDPPCATSGASG